MKKKHTWRSGFNKYKDAVVPASLQLHCSSVRADVKTEYALFTRRMNGEKASLLLFTREPKRCVCGAGFDPQSHGIDA